MIRVLFSLTVLLSWAFASASASAQDAGKPTPLPAVHEGTGNRTGPKAEVYRAPQNAQPRREREPGPIEASSLGSLLRDRKEALLEGGAGHNLCFWLIQESDREENEASDHEDSEQNDDDGDNVKGGDDDGGDQDETAARRRSTQRHVIELRKPIGEVHIQATQAGQRVPENRAATYTRKEPLIMIAALGATPPLPNRYTVGFMHRPLYFEQRNLERCGRSCRYLQNAVSGAALVATTIMMPYHLCHECPHRLVPCGGDCRTCERYPLDCDPLDYRALVTQAAATAGFSFLLL